jgi:hypothetical protein
MKETVHSQNMELLPERGLAAALDAVIERFVAWLEQAGYSSYDPYDIWGTNYGRVARQLYYAGRPVGFVLTAPVLLMEVICPRWRTMFVKKHRYATADAQLVLAFLNLYEKDLRPSEFLTEYRSQGRSEGASWKTDDSSTESSRWLNKARELAEEILNYSVSGFSGKCWGYPFDWQNVNGLIPRNTPHITTTPYCFEAFLRLFDITKQDRYLEVARSIARFVFNDLKDTPTSQNAAASSYTPYDRGKVVNASAYRAYVLFEAAERFSLQAYADKAWSNLRFILQNQQPDGSWFYAIDSHREAFIDNFHTCFVLKNLYKINAHLQDSDTGRAIRSGFAYYRQMLFTHNKLPKSFAIAPRLEIVKLEMYNIAEAITLGALIHEEFPEALTLASSLAKKVLDHYQHKAGYFVTRVYWGGIKHTMPFLRWPQAQLFYAVTNLLHALGRVEHDVLATQAQC